MKTNGVRTETASVRLTKYVSAKQVNPALWNCRRRPLKSVRTNSILRTSPIELTWEIPIVFGSKFELRKRVQTRSERGDQACYLSAGQARFLRRASQAYLKTQDINFDLTSKIPHCFPIAIRLFELLAAALLAALVSIVHVHYGMHYGMDCWQTFVSRFELFVFRTSMRTSMYVSNCFGGVNIG